MPKHNLNPIYTQDEKRPLCATFSADLTPSAQCLPPWNVCVFTLTCSSCGSRGGGTRTKNFLQHTVVCSLTENTQLWHMPLSHLNMHTKKWIFCCITQTFFKYIKVNLWPTWLNLLSLKMLFHYLQHWRMTVAFHLLKAARQSFQNCHDVALCLFASSKMNE